MKGGKMKGLKITGIVFLIVLFLASLGINCWYLWVKTMGQEVIVSETYKVGLQTLADGSESRHFVEVNYYSNDLKDGVELYEIKFNYMLDEERKEFFSQGLQYVNYDNTMSFKTQILRDRLVEYDKNFWGWETKKYDSYIKMLYDNETEEYNYMSFDDYENTTISTNPIGNDTFFKINIGDDLYGMQFKGDVARGGYVEFDGDFWTTSYRKTLDTYDYRYFAGAIFNSISTLENGKSSACVFEFADLFNYYEYDEEKQQYLSDPLVWDRAELIKKEVKSYYSIKVNKYANGAKKASDSLFNCIDGSSSFNMSGVESEDYFIGRAVVDCDIYDFDKVTIEGNYIALKLSDEFNQENLENAKLIYLDIVIDLDKLKAQGYTFVGFTADSGLSNYTIHSCQTCETVDGELTYSEVAYV